MRVLRAFNIVAPLRVLALTVIASFLPFFWSMLLLFVTILVFGMMMCQLVHPFLSDPALDEDLKAWLYLNYGTAGRCTWTVFEVTFAGSWPALVRPLIEDVSLVFAFVCGAYIALIVFAMTRIITALFLKDTLAVCSRDAELMIQEKLTEKRRFANRLLEFFSEADTSGDGVVSKEEFQHLLENPMVRTFLSTLELDPSESSKLFDMLDDGDGTISPEEFVEGAMRCKGSARAQDVIPILKSLKHLNKMLHDLYEEFRHFKSAAEGGPPPERVEGGRGRRLSLRS